MADIPQHFSLTFSSQQIVAVCERLGQAITPWARQVTEQSGRDIVAVPILRGGLFFFADLVRAISTSVEVAPLQTSFYEEGQNNVVRHNGGHLPSSVSHFHKRSVLLVDDICDSGQTLASLKPHLLAAGATEVRSAVLIRRLPAPAESIVPDWVGFDYQGPEWFVGYGMEDSGRWRNLPNVYVIKAEPSRA
jgi:hypoxanthine phosphoribosyltransferase